MKGGCQLFNPGSSAVSRVALPTNPFNPTSGLTRSPNNCAVHVTNGDAIAAFNSHSPLTTRRKQKGWHERSNLKDTIAGHMEFPRVGIEQLCGNNIHCREEVSNHGGYYETRARHDPDYIVWRDKH